MVEIITKYRVACTRETAEKFLSKLPNGDFQKAVDFGRNMQSQKVFLYYDEKDPFRISGGFKESTFETKGRNGFKEIGLSKFLHIVGMVSKTCALCCYNLPSGTTACWHWTPVSRTAAKWWPSMSSAIVWEIASFTSWAAPIDAKKGGRHSRTWCASIGFRSWPSATERLAERRKSSLLRCLPTS